MWGAEAERWDGMEVQLKKDVMVQARKGGKDADGCEVEGQKVVAECTDAEGCESTGTNRR